MLSNTLNLIFYEVAVLLFIASLLGVIAVRLKQPLIMAFILSGILVSSPAVPSQYIREHLELLSGLGVALLLFLVGLKLDLKLIKSLGRVALATGIGQILFTSVIGFLICRLLSMDPLTSAYVAVALTFSSTIIIVKLLSDKRELECLHGRIAVGFLIVQDIAVIVAMIFISAFTAPAQPSLLATLESFVIRALGISLVFAFVLTRILPKLIRLAAKTREMLILFAISWAVCLAALSHFLGFSKEIGAFLAGVSIASTDYRELVAARLVSLRDFLLLFFFVDLGMSLQLSLLGEQMGSAALLSLFVLIGNPLIVMAIMGYLGYRKKTGFLAGLTVAQISEFSLIFAALGLQAGHIDEATVGLITLVGLVTISMSTYMILYSQRLYDQIADGLRIFERKRPMNTEEVGTAAFQPEIIVFGLGRFGSELMLLLAQQGWKVIGVDYDPTAVNAWRKEGLTVWYGDAEDPEFPDGLPFGKTQWIISTLPDTATNRVLTQALREAGYKGRLALTAHRADDERELRMISPELILRPFVDAADKTIHLLTENRNQAA